MGKKLPATCSIYAIFCIAVKILFRGTDFSWQCFFSYSILLFITSCYRVSLFLIPKCLNWILKFPDTTKINLLSLGKSWVGRLCLKDRDIWGVIPRGKWSATPNVQRAIFGQINKNHSCLEPQNPLTWSNIDCMKYMPTFDESIPSFDLAAVFV